MKTGEVVQIRVLPRHVQAAIALVRLRGLSVQGMSLASAISHGLKIALDTLVANGAIEAPDPFAYAAETAPFRAGSREGKLVHSLMMDHAVSMAQLSDQTIDLSLPTSRVVAHQALAHGAALSLALEDLQIMTPLFASWAEFFRENPYWRERRDAGVTEAALQAAAGPSHPWNTASGTSSPASEAQA